MWLSGAVAAEARGRLLSLSTGWLLSIVCSLACVIASRNLRHPHNSPIIYVPTRLLCCNFDSCSDEHCCEFNNKLHFVANKRPSKWAQLVQILYN